LIFIVEEQCRLASAENVFVIFLPSYLLVAYFFYKWSRREKRRIFESSDVDILRMLKRNIHATNISG
jgi:hypothetical protein